MNTTLKEHLLRLFPGMSNRRGNPPDAKPSPSCALHIRCGVAATLTAVLILVVLGLRAGSRLRRFAPRLAALNLPAGTHGLLLQRQIFLRPHCLPVYGSSELSIVQPTRPDLFFRRQKQGFDVALIGQTGDRCLIMLQELAALGEAARGKKVVVFLSPVWFLPPAGSEQRDHALKRQFAGTFSPLLVGECALDGVLNLSLRREIAARLLDYDRVIRERSPLLHGALEALSARTFPQALLFRLLTPLLTLQDGALKVQERFYWLEVVHGRNTMRPAGSMYSPRRKRENWRELLQTIDHKEAKTGQTAFYSRGRVPDGPGLEMRGSEPPAIPVDRDEDFLRRMQGSPEWIDLELLLRTAKTLGIHLLLIDQPINGLYSDREGVTATARREYYDQIGRLAATYHVPVKDFSAYEEDRTFFADLVHPSAKAWVFYDQALDEFYHRSRR